jgi:hypothetical protein
MMRSVPRLGLAAVAVCLATASGLTACSGSSSSPTTSSAATSSSNGAPGPSSPAPSSSSATSNTPSEAAAQQYLSITAAVNADAVAFAALPSSSSVTTVHAAAVKLATDERTVVQKLRAASWPPAAQGAVTALADAASREVFVYEQASMAPTIAAIKTVLETSRDRIAARAAAAAQVRAALGLPVTPASSSAEPSGSASTA